MPYFSAVTQTIHLIVNPAAGGGRARRKREQAIAALGALGPLEVRESAAARDETRLAIEAAESNARALVVLGGDGSVSHAARGLIAAKSQVPLAIFAAGTGNDFAKSLGIPAHDYAAMAQMIGASRVRTIDAGEIDGVPFVNAAGLGFDVAVLQRMQDPRAGSWLQGTPRYVITAVQSLLGYPGFDAAVSALANGAQQRWLTIVFANGRWFGGAFQIAPHARLDNGLLETVAIADATPVGRAALFARALRGAHLSRPEVKTASSAAVTLVCPDAPHFEVDGELHHAQRATVLVRCLPGALRVIAG